MKTKKVNRYWCDFCKKSGGAAGHMLKHERGCTKNPNRICRVCVILQEVQKPIEELMALLPPGIDMEPDAEGFFPDTSILRDATKLALPELRKACGNCPACIMAALRQKGIPVYMAEDYNWTDEMKAVWTIVNEEKRDWNPQYV